MKNITKTMKWTHKIYISIFHKCKMETVDIPHSNKKGEIWFQECVCGKQQEVMFNYDGECVRIKQIQNKYDH
mgnify:CR=1 FL=1